MSSKFTNIQGYGSVSVYFLKMIEAIDEKIGLDIMYFIKYADGNSTARCKSVKIFDDQSRLLQFFSIKEAQECLVFLNTHKSSLVEFTDYKLISSEAMISTYDAERICRNLGIDLDKIKNDNRGSISADKLNLI